MKKLIIFLLIILVSGCTPKLAEITESQILMGTTAKITVIDQDKVKAENAITLSFDEIKRIDNLMSTFLDDSPVSILNKNGYLENPEITDIIIKSNYYSVLTDGAFDISVKPILDLYKISFEELKRPPTDAEIKQTLELVNYNNILVDGSAISLDEDMKITLGGIAKGYAVDKAIEVLKSNGIENALVNLGGDIKAIGAKPNEPWKIALENPRDKNQYITIIDLEDKAVATSGDYERYFDSDKKFHHIVNPRTGYSAIELISVTIIANTALEADAIATSVFVLGPEKGLLLVESLSNVEALLVTKDRDVLKSTGFRY